MSAVSEVWAVATSEDGSPIGKLRIAVLPSTRDAASLRCDKASDDGLAEIQVVEGFEYLYEWIGEGGQGRSIVIEPVEAFQPDTLSGLRGRLKSGLRTGLMRVEVAQASGQRGGFDIEVLSRKLGYLSEYRWMLRDIAQRMSELVMSRFAASGAYFAPDATRDAATLYQRFAFLRALLDSEMFRNAMSEIVRRPHVAFEEVDELVMPGQPMRAGSFLARELSRGGQRQASPAAVMPTVPATLRNRRSEVTHDTTANRFIRFALRRWEEVLREIDDGLASCEPSAPVRRGRVEIGRALLSVEQWLLVPLFKEAGDLTRFPSDDQVLHRRAGYRDVFRSYVESELAAHLTWRSESSSYLAGQRDVATLYEYWAFFQLAEIVARIVGSSFDAGAIIGVSPFGLDVALKKDRETILSGIVDRHGRQLRVRLCFNRTFSTTNRGSWTVGMRPDYSLLIGPGPEEGSSFEPIVLHFDAKYRVECAEEMFGEVSDNGATELSGRAVRDDLLKMHTYRDAIRRTSGAYVLYPGSDSEPTTYREYDQYHELLPGLGAFVLRPSEGGQVFGSTALATFVDDVISHVATRLTRHERSRYWLSQTYARYGADYERGAGEALEEPSGQTSVLLGYVRDGDRWRWISDQGIYNVRASGRRGGVAGGSAMLYCRLLLLYGPGIARVMLVRSTSDPEFVREAAMAAAGYPSPRGDYWCIQIAPTSRQHVLDRLSSSIIERFAVERTGAVGAPTLATWDELRLLCLDKR